jgi:hypothetical protein
LCRPDPSASWWRGPANDQGRVAVRVEHDLHVAAVSVVLAGVPQVMTALYAHGGPVGSDERTVQAHQEQPGSVGSLGRRVPAFMQPIYSGSSLSAWSP